MKIYFGNPEFEGTSIEYRNTMYNFDVVRDEDTVWLIWKESPLTYAREVGYELKPHEELFLKLAYAEVKIELKQLKQIDEETFRQIKKNVEKLNELIESGQQVDVFNIITGEIIK